MFKAEVKKEIMNYFQTNDSSVSSMAIRKVLHARLNTLESEIRLLEAHHMHQHTAHTLADL